MKRTIIGTLALVTFAAPTTVTAAPSHMTSRCTQYEPLLAQYAPRGGWDVRRMSKIMWRESRCQAAVVNRRGGDTGLLQIHPINWSYLSSKFGVTVNRAWLQNPTNNVRAAAALCTFARRAWGTCYRPWAVR
jgi:hypothetical protein